MSYFYFGKTSDVGLVVIFINKPEKSGLDENCHRVGGKTIWKL